MAPSQEDHAPPTSNGKPRPDRGVDFRPMLLIVGAGIALGLAGFLIGLNSPPSADMWSWYGVGSLLFVLGVFLLFVIPGALVTLRHPWADGLRLPLEKRVGHPRLAAMTIVWAGLGLACASVLIWLSTAHGWDGVFNLVIANMGLVAVGPLLAVSLFDRRRQQH